MYNPVSLRRELSYVGAALLALWGLCEYMGVSCWLPAIAAIAYLCWHLYHLWTLMRWLDGGSRRLPLDVPGVWGYIYQRLEARRRKAAKRKKQVGRLLKQFKSSTRALPDATIVLNKHFNIQWLNSAATDILGIRKSDVGQPITSFIRDPEFIAYLDKGNFKDALELQVQHVPETRMSVLIVPYEGKQYLLLARDITREHLLVSMRRDFVSNASHELRTPLSVLQGSAEQMEQMIDENSPLDKPLARMRRQCERMMGILQDLLILARLEGSKELSETCQVNLSQLVQEVVEEARTTSGHQGGHRFQCEIEDEVHVEGERENLHVLISNLIMNAVRYTPPGGNINVELFLAPLGLRFMVTDTGVGILPQHLPRLTERFYRVDVGRSREAGGTGLGLSIVKHILERYGSVLEISSEYGVGSSFGFTLPSEILCDSDLPEQQANAGA
ncbi:MAG: phosphate regulon sensor histidine kinase PhoR [Thiohalobacterales bacterium]|nr:phosphate regulon sensor histidine kinase PhoR [Thiohalobacterales bacterium]